MIDNLPWYQSKIIIGALISAIGKLLVLSGVIANFTPEHSEALATALVLVIGGVGDIVAISSRITQKVAPPITLKKER